MIYSQNRIDIDSLTARAYGASLSGKGVYDIQSGAYEADADVDGLDLSAVPACLWPSWGVCRRRSTQPATVRITRSWRQVT